VDRLDADGTRVSGQESTNPAISHTEKNTLFRGRGLKCRCHRDFGLRSDRPRNTIIIMRPILHDHAPNTYYGQWPQRFVGKRARMRRSIAQEAPLPVGLSTALAA
jgi:hypothetical protein